LGARSRHHPPRRVWRSRPLVRGRSLRPAPVDPAARLLQSRRGEEEEIVGDRRRRLHPAAFRRRDQETRGETAASDGGAARTGTESLEGIRFQDPTSIEKLLSAPTSALPYLARAL